MNSRESDALADTADQDPLPLAALMALFCVPVPAIYTRVDGLAELRRALALEGFKEARRRFHRSTDGMTGEAALSALAHAYLDFARERPDLYVATLHGADDGEDDVGEASANTLSLVISILSTCGIAGNDALHATRGLRAIVHGFVAIDAVGGYRMKLNLDEAFDRTISALAAGFSSRAAT